MRLDELAIAARRRNNWEAIDLGWMMARRWWRPLLLSYALPSGALLLLLSACLPAPWLWCAGVAVWWCKPIWDCAPLYIGSRLLFGTPVSPRQAWQRLPRLLRWEALRWLSLRRFSLHRSADLPLTVLEQLRGDARRQRLGPLHQGMANGAAWLTTVCVHLEVALVLGIVFLVQLMLPAEVEFRWLKLSPNDAALPQHLFNLACWLAMVATAPFYTMAGFSLYLNRRIELEGWDIEVRFRHLAASMRAAAPAVLALLCALMLAPVPEARAEAADAGAIKTVDRAAQAQSRIQAILNSEELRERPEHTVLRFKDDDDASERPVSAWLVRIIEYLEAHSSTFRAISDWFERGAAVVEFLLWVVAISLALFLLLRYRRTLQAWLPRARDVAPAPPPATLFGWDMTRREPAVASIARAEEHWRNGHARAAVGELYQLALIQLLHRFGLPLREHHTEAECLALVAQQRLPLMGAFAELTRAWQQVAYRHRAPSAAQWATLCATWSELCDGAA